MYFKTLLTTTDLDLSQILFLQETIFDEDYVPCITWGKKVLVLYKNITNTVLLEKKTGCIYHGYWR